MRQYQLNLKKSWLILCLALIQVQGFGQGAKPSSKVSQLLEQSGYSYSKDGDNLWTMNFRGKALGEFKVIITSVESMAALLVVVAKRKELNPTPELMRTLLRMNDDFDKVKVVVDKDGDLLVRVDTTIRIMDLDELKANVEQVAAAADEVAKAIKPYTIKSK